MKRCRNCGRTVWEQISGAPPNPNKGTGIYYHYHNWDRLCFPNQVAEVDEDNPGQEWPVEPAPWDDFADVNLLNDRHYLLRAE